MLAYTNRFVKYFFVIIYRDVRIQKQATDLPALAAVFCPNLLFLSTRQGGTSVIIPLILTRVISDEQIPYFFLDFRHMGAVYILGCFLFIYGIGYLWSLTLSGLNRKLYWLWFKNIAG